MPAVIKDLRACPFDLPLIEPFIIATGRKDAANNVLIEVELDDGTIGYGEVAPSPYTTGDTAATCIAIVEQLRPLVVGKDVRQWRALLGQTRRAVRHQFAAHSGLEIAVLDAFGKATGVPLYEFFGGVSTRVESDYTLSLGTPEETAAAARKAVAAGFRKIKIKVGMGVATDVARVAAVREVAPDAELSLDANQAFSPQAAVELAHRIAALGIEISLLEQPVRRDDFTGMRFVRERAGVPVGADETVFTPEDAIRVVREGAADVINIKVAKAGLLGALDIYSIARAANLELMIGCMMESKVGLSASVHLACGLGCFTHCDLDSVFLLKPFECDGGYSLLGPVFNVEGHGPGTGIALGKQ
ncbi:MAG: dipeptide epimerase [Candidatus Sumerlaeaceae bacterium]|nr:dipeptide epimerase [Candidatus Sumerlaeaceae bacterium]